MQPEITSDSSLLGDGSLPKSLTGNHCLHPVLIVGRVDEGMRTISANFIGETLAVLRKSEVKKRGGLRPGYRPLEIYRTQSK